MEKYERLDQVVKYMFTAEELANYLAHNYREYAITLAESIDMEMIIEDKEREDKEREDAREY